MIIDFVKKQLKRVIIIGIVVCAVLSFLNAGSAVINNYIALGQMENNDLMFILMEMYNSFIRPTLNVVMYAIVAFIGFAIGTDIYKFYKLKSKEKETNEKN